MEQHASTLKEVIGASVIQVSGETSVNKISTNVITTRVRMEEHVLTLLVDITARVHRGLRENTVTKI